MSEEEKNHELKAAAAQISRSIFFRLAFLAQEMCIHPDDKIKFEGVGEYAVSVDFVNVGAMEAQRWWRSSSVRCTGTVRRQLPRRAFAVYKAIWAGSVPEEIDPKYPLVGLEQRGRSFDPAYVDMTAPAFLNDAIAPIEAEITRVVAQVVGLTRWRCNRTGPVDMPTLGFHEWSIDGEAWKPDIRPPMPTVRWGPDLVISPARQADIEQLLNAGGDEPLYYSLLREAESLVESNPRSAVIISATAAEVAVKTLVSKLAPQTLWLVQNLPSPPIVKILVEYLPRLLPPGSPQLDPELIADLKTAVLLRNTLTHGFQGNLELARISSALATFRDVVWLCDYFAGVAWAANRVSQRFITAMRLPTTVDTSGWFVD